MDIKIENTEVLGWEHAIRGMRNPYSIEGAENNSWDKSDSAWTINDSEDADENGQREEYKPVMTNRTTE